MTHQFVDTVYLNTGLFQGLHPANERRHYKVTPPFIGLVQWISPVTYGWHILNDVNTCSKHSVGRWNIVNIVMYHQGNMDICYASTGYWFLTTVVTICQATGTGCWCGCIDWHINHRAIFWQEWRCQDQGMMLCQIKRLISIKISWHWHGNYCYICWILDCLLLLWRFDKICGM